MTLALPCDVGSLHQPRLINAKTTRYGQGLLGQFAFMTPGLDGAWNDVLT
jgi:hypothetical protein